MLFISPFLSFHLINNFSNESGHIFFTEGMNLRFSHIWPLYWNSTNHFVIDINNWKIYTYFIVITKYSNEKLFI